MTEEERSEAGITTPVGSVSFKGKQMAEVIAILCLCLLFLMSYVIYEHKMDARADNLSLASAIKELSHAQRESNQILREQVCLLSLPQDRREKEFTNDNSLCKRLSRER